jgi:hypothetical protein
MGIIHQISFDRRRGHIDIPVYKTNESKLNNDTLFVHAYTYTNRTPPIFTVCGHFFCSFYYITIFLIN